MDEEALKTIAVVILTSIALTLVVSPLAGTAGTFPSESIQTEGGFLLENDHIVGDNNSVFEAQNDTSTTRNVSMARFELNNVVVDENNSVSGIDGARVTKNFVTPDGHQFMMQITGDRMEIEGPDDGVPDMRLWASEFHGESILAFSGATSLDVNCWTDQPSQEGALTLIQGLLSVDISNAQFKAHKMAGQDVTIDGFELDMKNVSTRYTVATHTNDTSPYGCHITL